MSDKVRYAILDTDFVSKANIIRREEEVLADEVMAFPGYRFFCHEKMVKELDDHGTNAAKEWLKDRISAGDIALYDDAGIIQELREVLGSKCFYYYRSMLKRGCDINALNSPIKYVK